ncbi:MAG: class I SAM-dependent methyltransferase [Methylococcales bacterium]|nr:class I SAM-dependent methyltransferase [Methylococcales bacterium]
MLKKSVAALHTYFPNLPWRISERWFEFISKLNSGTAMLFMNYGYADLDPDAPILKLLPKDEGPRYSTQLYHHTANAIDLHGKDIIEIGCGRGGGSDYVQRYLRPKSTIGVDLAASAIEFCNKHYDVEGLSFERGNAEELTYPDGSFDAILNVESSICYQHVEQFFSEVVRLLKPGGYFLYADLRNLEEIEEWEAQLARMPLEMIEQEDITPNVLRSLDLDHDRKQSLINKYAPRFLHKPFNEFAGMKDSQFFYGAFKNRTKIYRRYLFRKPE